MGNHYHVSSQPSLSPHGKHNSVRVLACVGRRMIACTVQLLHYGRKNKRVFKVKITVKNIRLHRGIRPTLVVAFSPSDTVTVERRHFILARLFETRRDKLENPATTYVCFEFCIAPDPPRAHSRIFVFEMCINNKQE